MLSFHPILFAAKGYIYPRHCVFFRKTALSRPLLPENEKKMAKNQKSQKL
jgi:hypothetical protein